MLIQGGNIMESIENASKGELLETIELLKEENEKTVDELLEKLEALRVNSSRQTFPTARWKER